MIRLGISLICAGVMAIVFVLAFGFPAAPPKPDEIAYADEPVIDDDLAIQEGTVVLSGQGKADVVDKINACIAAASALNGGKGGTCDASALSSGAYVVDKPIKLTAGVNLVFNR